MGVFAFQEQINWSKSMFCYNTHVHLTSSMVHVTRSDTKFHVQFLINGGIVLKKKLSDINFSTFEKKKKNPAQ